MIRQGMIRVGIIGSGFGQYGLLPAFRAVRGCKVVALCGQPRPQLVAYCKKIGFDNLYTDWRRMIDTENLDAIAIAVPPAAQYIIAKTALARGLHVFAEKPLAATLKQAHELARLAKKAKTANAVDFIFPELAAWQKVLSLLQKNRYGSLQHMSVDWDFLSYNHAHGLRNWKNDPRQGGGVVSFFASHTLHYVEQFAGRIRSIRSAHTSTNLELLLTFASGVTGDVHVACNNPSLTRHRLLFYCTRGVIELSSRSRVVDKFSITVRTSRGTKKIPVTPTRHGVGDDPRVALVKKLAQRFIRACQNGKQMSPSFHDGLRVQKLINEITLTKGHKKSTLRRG